MYASTVLSLLLLAGQVASVGVNVAIRHQISSLLPRQTDGGISSGDVPSQCQSSCTVIDTVQACADDTCICTSSVVLDLQTCFDCVLSAEPDSANAAQVAQADMNGIVAMCDQAGLSVPSISLTASGSGSGPAPTSASSQAPGTSAPAGTSNTGVPSATFSAPASGTSSTPPAATSSAGGGGAIGGNANAGVASAVPGVFIAGVVGWAVLVLGL
ncbi:hypothetical protein B0H21DRAFT_748677 [Amylocystis lapponica]|nr:hypothetical protein B0H21DRAFT_748677 [Amylocystis lapponica]